MYFKDSALLNNGIYLIPDAARFTKVSQRRIRYWLQGRSSEGQREGAGRHLWKGQLVPIASKFALGFLDLQEIRFVHAFLEAGVSWPILRAAHAHAKTLFHVEHPFCTRGFVTDGRDIFDSISSSSTTSQLTDSARGQRVFPQVIKPFIKELRFSESNTIESWWPLGMRKQVVLDPTRHFGQPITAGSCIPTEVLFQAIMAGQSIDEVSAWYEIDPAETKDAQNFELSLRS